MILPALFTTSAILPPRTILATVAIACHRHAAVVHARPLSSGTTTTTTTAPSSFPRHQNAADKPPTQSSQVPPPPQPQPNPNQVPPPPQQQPQPQPQQLPAPSAAAANSQDTTIKLDVSGQGSSSSSSSSVRILDGLGPLVVNVDGSISRITNWADMTDAERQTTLRMVSRRNRQRLDALKQTVVKE